MFTKCGFASALYVEVFKWLGLVIEIMEKITNLLEIFLYFGSERKLGEGGVIGLAYNFLVNLDGEEE